MSLIVGIIRPISVQQHPSPLNILVIIILDIPADTRDELTIYPGVIVEPPLPLHLHHGAMARGHEGAVMSLR